MIRVTPSIELNETEISLSFIRASGPGGQNVNKVSTAVQLRFDIRHSPSLTYGVRQRLERLAGHRVSSAGVLVITAQRFSSQERNRRDAIARLVALVGEAARPPKIRRPTRPTRGSRERRLDSKRRRSHTKQTRKARFDFT
jgi:ribosome-associated protein